MAAADPEMIAAVKAAAKEAVQEELGKFEISPEEHFKQHLFLEGLMTFANNSRNWILSTVIKTIVGGILLLLLLGFIFWGKNQFN